jgi:hypothetical protein
MAMSVEGVLKNYTPKQFEKAHYDCFKDAEGRLIHPREARRNLEELWAQGVHLIPMGDCDAFDPVTGCPGHPVPDTDDLAPPLGSDRPGAEGEGRR